jgi:CheY-like chemotaxis protein
MLFLIGVARVVDNSVLRVGPMNDGGTAPSHARAIGNAGEPSPSRRVLVIEDDAEVGTSLRDVLALLGHTVEWCRDGRSALERAVSFHPEVVLCDIGLPDLDGYEVARAIRAAPEIRSAYVVALSGYAQPDHLARAAQAGFDRHIAKPPSLDDLVQALRDARPHAA